MLITPQRHNASRKRMVVGKSVPAPVGGWNARDGLAEMPPEDAVQLDNSFPNTGSCDLRGGTERHVYYAGQLTSFTRSTTATYFDSDGILQTAAIDTPRYTSFSVNGPGSDTEPQYDSPILVIESSVTNYCLYSRDLSDATWTKTNMTASKNATGLDGVANSATTITATSDNATVTQTLTCATGGNIYFFFKRVSGTGQMAITFDGSTWNNFTTTTTAGFWVKVSSGAGGTNPTIGFRINTSGDSFIIDGINYIVPPLSHVFPIFTTSAAVTLGADTPTYGSGADSTTSPAAVETLMVYANGTTNKMLAACNGNIYNTTSSGAAGIPVSTGYSNDRWSYEHMGGYIVMVNGADTPIKYDGSSVTTTTITGSGLTATDLSYVCQLQNRLFFIEKDTLSVWYLATNAIAGAATEIDFTGIFSLGGKLVAIGRWTRDGGEGMDDVSCFFTDKGEVAVYAGTDPASASTWALIGVFRIGAPIGDRPLMNNGADLIVITEDGYAPLSKVLPVDRVGSERYTISDKIRNEVNASVNANRTRFGWQAVLYPKGHFALFNVPTVEGSKAEQHVINTLTGAWCRFKDIRAVCWTVFNDNLYFGAPGGFVCLADTEDYKDDTLVTDKAFSLIQQDIVPSFNYFGNPGQQKHFKMARPVIYSNGVPEISTVLNTDFERKTPSQVDTTATSGTPWGSPWGSPWGLTLKVKKDWLGTSAIGYNGSLHIRTRTSGISVSLNSIDYLFERGGVL